MSIGVVVLANENLDFAMLHQGYAGYCINGGELVDYFARINPVLHERDNRTPVDRYRATLLKKNQKKRSLDAAQRNQGYAVYILSKCH